MSIQQSTQMAGTDQDQICINRLSGNNIEIDCMIEDQAIQAVVDTAADVTVLSEKLYKQKGFQIPKQHEVNMKAAGENLSFNAWKTEKINIIVQGIPVYRSIYIAPINDDMLLGIDILKEINAKIVVREGEVKCEATTDKTEEQPEIRTLKIRRVILEKNNGQIPVILPENVVVKGNCETRLPVPVKKRVDSTMMMFQPSALPVLTARGIHQGTKHVAVSFMNLEDETIKLKKGTCIGYVRAIEIKDEVRIEEKEKRRGENEELPGHIKPLLEDARGKITKESLKKLDDMLWEYQDIFAKDDFDVGNFTAMEHKIETGDTEPIKLPLRRTPVHFVKEEEQMLTNMLQAGIIEESNSSWGAATVLVRKKCGKIRWCIDYRKLNKATKKDVFPLPLMEECIDALQGVQWFSKIDCNSAYWQIPIQKDSREKTAFRTKYGLFHFNKLPFGLCNSPSTYGRAMNMVLKGLNWDTVLAFLDDICVIGRTEEEHLTNLEQVFKRFKEFHMKLKPRKCSIFQKEVEFLGRRVGVNGVKLTDQSKEVIEKWKDPETVKELEQFLGLANYHRRFVKNFSKIVDPLNQLMRTKDFEWGKEQRKAFEEIKRALLSPEVLTIPDTKGKFVLDCDASTVAIGAQLSQIQQGEERTIAYGSLALTPSQRSYCTTRQELLSVVRFTAQFKHYLLGRNFLCRTDHNSLIWLLNFKQLDGQAARWHELLSEYDMEIKHRPGKLHQNADALSRRPSNEDYCSNYKEDVRLEDLPCKGCNYCKKLHDAWDRFNQDIDATKTLTDKRPQVNQVRIENEINRSGIDIILKRAKQETTGTVRNMAVEEIGPGIVSQKEMEEAQKEDIALGLLRDWLEKGKKADEFELNLSSEETKFYYGNRDIFFLSQGIIYKKDPEEDKLVVPRSKKEEVLRACHEIPSAGHQGRDRTKERVKQRFFWLHLGRDVEAFVRKCKDCNVNKSHIKNRHPQIPYHAGNPMDRIHLDFLGPFPTSKNGNKYILVMVDSFTKWLEVVPLPDQTAERTARTAVNEFFCRFGYPHEVLTDQGRNFESELFQKMCKLLKIHKKRTTAYRPSCNGQAERCNRTLMNAVRCFIESQDEWDIYLPQIAAAIRSAVNRTTGFTPNLLMLGREVRTPVELMFPGAPTEKEEVEEFIEKMRDSFLKAHETARKTLKVVLKRSKKLYDLKTRKTEFNKGDVVYVLNQSTGKGEAKKLNPKWQGPGVIIHQFSPILFQVRLKNRSTKVLNHDTIKKCTDGEIPQWIVRLQEKLKNSEEDLYCFCNRPDDGYTMVQCELCLEWYHGSCLGLTSAQIHKLKEFLCSKCDN